MRKRLGPVPGKRPLSVVLAASVILTACGSSGNSGPSAEPEGVLTEEVALPKLPAPAPLPSDVPEEAAAALAAAVVGGNDSVPSLLTALGASGLPVLDDSGDPLVEVPPGSWVAMASWEALLLDGIARAGSSVTLEDVTAAMVGSVRALGDDVPVPDEDEMAKLVLSDLREAAQSDSPPLRFWAHFTNQVGLAAGGSDLLTDKAPEDVLLTGLQGQLLLRRFGGAVISSAVETADPGGEDPGRGSATLAPPEGSVAGTSRPIDMALATAGTRRVASASFRPRASAKPPCTFTSAENWIVTAGEEGIARGMRGITIFDHSFRGVIGYMNAELGKVGKYTIDVKDGLKVAQVVFDYVKLIAYYLALHAEIEMDGSGPLERTKKERPQTGERRTLTATVSYDVENWQVLNCMRLAFAHAGLKFNVPQHGPASGAGISWVGVTGFDARGDRIVQWVGRPDRQVADDAGRASIRVEGFGQKKEVPSDAEAVIKEFTVRLLVQMKSANMAKDLVDALKTAATGQWALRIPAELAYRTRVISFTETFPLRDWAGAYLVEFVLPGDGLISGVKCGGPAGKWTMDMSWPGANGSITAVLDAKTLSGPGEGSVTMAGATADFPFTVTFIPGTPPHLFLKTLAQHYTFSIGGDSIAGGGDLDIPLKIGTCE